MDEVITEIMKREGWDTYTNHPADRGGPTKWGITLKAWEDYVDHSCTEDDIKAINEGQARDFYMKLYIAGPHFDDIENEHVRELVIDCGVNHGTSPAAKWLQKAVEVEQDGAIGPISLADINSTDSLKMFLDVVAYRIQFYGRLVTDKPEQAVFAAGWNNRAAGFLEDASSRIAAGLGAV